MVAAAVLLARETGSTQELTRSVAIVFAITFGSLFLNVESDSRVVPGGITATSWSMGSSAVAFSLVVFGEGVTAVAATLASLTMDVVIRRRVFKWGTLLNAWSCSLPIVLAGLCLRAIGGEPGTLSLPGDLAQLIGTIFLLSVLTEGWFASAHFVERVHESGGARMLALSVELRATVPYVVATTVECLAGLTCAVVFLLDPWALPLIAPLGASIYLAMLRGNHVQQVTESALESFASIVDERDRYTFEHSTRVCEYAMAIGRHLGYSERRLASLYWTAKLHDLGKVAIDNAILNKPGRLTDEEFEVMKTHPVISARLLNQFSFDEVETDVVLCHHERYDGRGYLRRAADDVPFDAFVIAVADTFDAMTSDRPYRAGMANEVALAEIHRNLGSQFHPVAGQAFLELMGFDAEQAKLEDAVDHVRPGAHYSDDDDFFEEEAA